MMGGGMVACSSSILYFTQFWRPCQINQWWAKGITLLLQYFDSAIGFAFWASLSMPDIYAIRFCSDSRITIGRVWQEGDVWCITHG